VLPPSDAPPPNTPLDVIFAFLPGLADILLLQVRFDYFGPSADVLELAIPLLLAMPDEVGCFSGPNATDEEAAEAVFFGSKPAGSEFILFFLRGLRSYVFDLATGDYCWIDVA
jgi:hypothetical protein